MSASQCQVPKDDGTFLRGPVYLKFTNNTSEPVHVRICGNYSQGFTDTTLQPGQTAYGGGKTASESVDVLTNITYANGDQVDAWGGNPAVGYPWVGFGSTSGSNWERFGVGETNHFTQSGHTFAVERDGDQGNNSKWFTVSINS